MEEAIGIASVLEFSQSKFNARANQKASTYKTVSQSLSVPDENGQPNLHIVNYEEGGYAIVSADNRVHPILAITELGSLTLKEKNLPEGLLLWLAETSEMVSYTKKINEPRTDLMIQSWELCETRAISLQTESPCPEDCDRNYFSQVSPLLSTIWNQGVGFNNYAPYMGCSSPANGRPPAGCVATATAQVMKYHQYPSNYPWSSMPDSSGSSATSLLMHDIGSSVNMNFGCEGSGAFTNSIPDALIDDFGYQSASYSDFSFWTLKQDLNAGRPVILSASKDEFCVLVWCVALKGHAWVVDGYIEYEVWDYACENGNVYVSLHMNWGWGGSYDGWYSYSDWSPGSSSYDYGKKMVHNINP